MSPLSRMFSPIQIGSMRLKNRIVMAPMTTDFGPDGERPPHERFVEFIERRARGGVGLITLEACSVDRKHPEVPNSLCLGDDEDLEFHRAVAAAAHAHDARIQPQIAHIGPDALSPFLSGIPTLGPSVIAAPVTGVPCKELSVDEIAEIVAQFGQAARRAREVGYDGVELHAAHAYMLLGSFLSPWRNKRADEYNGRSIEGRTRFVIEAIRSVKQSAGEDFPLTLRISGYERAPGGRDLQDTQRIAPLLAEAGVDAFHVSGGVSDRFVSQIVCGTEYVDGHNVAGAHAVKRVVDVPVMAVGRIHDPRFGERVLREEKADLIVMGRPLLADPDLPEKAERGAFAEIRRCISCQNCIDAMARGTMNCAVNAQAGREGSLSLARSEHPKRVLVIGGGPGGMEAARVAALRGHQVSLYEKSTTLGGAFSLACAVHPSNQTFLDYLLRQMEVLPVEVCLGEAMDPERVRALAPDAVIVATGGAVEIPSIPGSAAHHVYNGPMLRRLLAGEGEREDLRKFSLAQRIGIRLLLPRLLPALTPVRLASLSRRWMPLGEHVVIVGADLVAIELAEFLSERGRRVSVVDHGEKIAPEVGRKRRAEHMNRLDALGVSVNTGVECTAIGGSSVELRSVTGVERTQRADSVVLAGTVQPNTQLLDGLKDVVPELYGVGDCTGLGLVRKATEDAMRAGCAL